MSKDIKVGEVTLSQVVSSIADKKEEPIKPESMKAKVASWYGDLDNLDIEKVVELQERMTNFMDTKFGKVRFAEKREMSNQELADLMSEYLEAKEIEAALSAVKDQVRAMYFLHLNAKFEAEGMSDEEAAQQKYREPVPSEGHSFDRYKTGRGPATLNQDQLRQMLGDKADKYFSVKLVEEVVLDQEALLADYADPDVQEALAKAVTPGNILTPSFTVRPFTKAEQAKYDK